MACNITSAIISKADPIDPFFPIIVYGHNAGGVVGLNHYSSFGGLDTGTVEDCYNTGNVTSMGNHAGGVVGRNDYSGTVRNCNARNVVVSANAGTDVGRIVGSNSSTGTLISNTASNVAVYSAGSPVTIPSNPTGDSIHGANSP